MAPDWAIGFIALTRRVELGTYGAEQQGKRPVEVERFATDIKKLCEASGVKFQVEDDQVYLLNVQLKKSGVRELEARS